MRNRSGQEETAAKREREREKKSRLREGFLTVLSTRRAKSARLPARERPAAPVRS